MLRFYFLATVLPSLANADSLSPSSAPQTQSRSSTRLIILGLPLTFLLGMPVAQVPQAGRVLAGMGGLLVALGLLGHLRVLRSQQLDCAWLVPLLFLVVKAVSLIGISVPNVATYAEQAGLRVSYLHWLLLGFATLGMVAAAKDVWGAAIAPGWRWLTATVLLLLATLIPLANLWPAAWSGQWAARLAAYAVIGPVAVSCVMLLAMLWGTAFTRFRGAAAPPRTVQPTPPRPR